MMNRLWSVFLGAALALAAGCATPLGNPADFEKGKEFTVGVVLPLSGEEGEFGKRMLNGITLAADEINQRNGIAGLKLRLLVRDTAGDPGKARMAAAGLVDAGVNAMIAGFNTAEGMQIAPVAEERGVPTFMPQATNEQFFGHSKLLYPTAFSDEVQGQALAAYIRKYRNLSKLGVIVSADEKSAYSRSIARNTAQAFDELDGNVVRVVEFRGDKEQFIESLREMLLYGPQAILIPATTHNSGLLIAFIRSLGYQGLLVGPDTWDEPELLEMVGEKPGDCAFTSLYSEEFGSAEQLAFKTAYRKRFFVYPSSGAAQGYDTMKLLALGMSEANSVEDLSRNMLSIRNMPGAAGLYSMDRSGVFDRSIFVKTIRPPARKGEPAEARLSESFRVRTLKDIWEEQFRPEEKDPY